MPKDRINKAKARQHRVEAAKYVAQAERTWFNKQWSQEKHDRAVFEAKIRKMEAETQAWIRSITHPVPKAGDHIKLNPLHRRREWCA